MAPKPSPTDNPYLSKTIAVAKRADASRGFHLTVRARRGLGVLLAAMIFILGSVLVSEILSLRDTSLLSIDSLAISVDGDTSALTVRVRGASFSYRSTISTTLCGCAIILPIGSVPATFRGDSCATLTRDFSRLDVDVAASPDAEVSAGLFSALLGGGSFLDCRMSLAGIPAPRVSVPLNIVRASSSGSTVNGTSKLPPVFNTWTADMVHPALSSGRFEFTRSSSLDLSSIVNDLPFALGELSINFPGLALMLRDDQAEAVAALALMPIAARVPSPKGRALASIVVAASPRSVFAASAPGLAVDTLAKALGVPADAVVGALAAMGVPLHVNASRSLATTLQLHVASVSAPDSAFDHLFGVAKAEEAAPVTCMADTALAAWARALLSQPIKCIRDPLLVIHVGATEESVSAAAALTFGAPAATPSVKIVLSSPGAGIDASIPRASIGATLSMSNSSFFAQGLYTAMTPYVGEVSVPVSVETRIPTEWRVATPAAGGTWNVGPARATDLWSSVSCGQGVASVAWAAGGAPSGVLIASAFAELPNALGCVNAIFQEYMIGPYAGMSISEAAVRDLATFSQPRGKVRLVLPSIGVFTLPLGIAARRWLAMSIAQAPTFASDVLPPSSRVPHNASVFPGVFALSEAVPGNPSLARVFGVSSHSGDVTTALAAGLESGCAAQEPNGFPVNCASWEALWRSAGFLGVDGLLLAGVCDSFDNPLQPCVSVSVESDSNGVFNFVGGGSFYMSTDDLLATIRSLPISDRAGRAPSRASYNDEWIAYEGAIMGAWSLRSESSWTALSVSTVMLYANIAVVTANDGQSGWFGFSNYVVNLPRVPVSCISVPLPGSGPSGISGFNLLDNEACSRKALAPLIDLGMDQYTYLVSGPNLDPISLLGWAASQPYEFASNILHAALTIVEDTGLVDTPRSRFSTTGLDEFMSIVTEGAFYASGLLTAYFPGSALSNEAIPLLQNFLSTSIGVSNLLLNVSVTLAATPIVTGSYSSTGVFNSSFGGSTDFDYGAAWYATWRLACALNPTYSRPVPILAYGTVQVSNVIGDTSMTPFNADVGSALAWLDNFAARLMPTSWVGSQTLVSEAILYGLARYAGHQVFTGRAPCAEIMPPSTSPTLPPMPSSSPSGGLPPSSAALNAGQIAGAAAGAVVLLSFVGIVALYVARRNRDKEALPINQSHNQSYGIQLQSNAGFQLLSH